MKNPFAAFFSKKIKLGHFIIICLVLIIAAVVLTYSAVVGGFGSAKYLDDAKKYIEIEKAVSDNYIGELPDGGLFNSAASGMVRSLGDKWSYYMTADEYETYKLSQSNEYQGIGISIKINDNGEFEISSVSDGTPAATAGITVGQHLVSVDGQAVADMSLTDVQTLIRSKLNKDFPVVVADSRGNEVTCTVACTVIYKSPVTNKLLDGNIGYIKISNFEAGCSEETISAIEYLLSIGAKSFVFDVRGNPGGLVSELVSVLDYILPEGDLFVSVDRDGEETVTSSDKICLKSNIVVLVDANSYSAAEFFAAALQEYNWATVIGEQTTGKSRSQITIELSDGSALHISTKKYLTPKRVDLAELGGVTPNVSVANTDDTDAQLAAAVKQLS